MKRYKLHIVLSLIIIITLVAICFVPISVSKLIPKVEAQIAKELGLDVHIEKLILRLGPNLKLKTPIMHVMYKDGRKFAQFNGIKFYIGYTSFLKGNPVIKNLTANKAIFKIDINDSHFLSLSEILNSKNYNDIPDITLKNYNITLSDKEKNENYSFNGQDFELNKLRNYKSFKFKSKGSFYLNNRKYLTYDLSLLPQIEISKALPNIKFHDIITQIVELDFHSDIIADVKVYKSVNDILQASGFVNVDNISVLDPAQKNSKSFVYLTLWGDKASILSNIYTSHDKKVCIEGMVNNSKKPILDIKIKTDEIELKDLYKKVKLFANLSTLKSLKSIEGGLSANFMLKGDLNKLKSNGYMKISNAKIKMDGLDIDKINSDIDFNNNTINIVNAIGYANEAPIMLKGKIDKNINLELLMSKVELKYLVPEKYGVKSGIISLNTNITGTLNAPVHKEKLLIDNLKIEKNDNMLSLDNVKLDTNKSNTAYLNDFVFSNKLTNNVKIPSAKLIFDGENIKIPSTDIFMDNSKLTAFADITNYSKECGFNAVIKGNINSRDIKKMTDNSAIYPVNITTNGNKLYQNIISQILLEKPVLFDEPTVINLVAKNDKNGIKIDDLSMVSFAGKFSEDFKQNLKGNKKIIISGQVENLTKPTLKNLRVFVPQMLNLHIGDTVMQTKGDLFLNGNINSPEIIGQANIVNLFNNQLQLAINNAVFDFNKNLVSFNVPMLKVNDTNCALMGNLLTDISEKLTIKNLSIKSKYLNTDTIIMYKDLPKFKEIPIEILDGKFYAERVQANVYSSPLYLTAFSANFNLMNNILQMKNISSEMFNGKIAGSIDYNLKDENFSSNIMGRSVSAAPIFDIISNRKDSISGTMDFDTTLMGELTSKDSLNGDIKFVVNNGRMSTLGKLEHLLYAQNVIADNMLRTSLSIVTKAITLKDTGLFKYLRGDVTLNKGVAQINLLQSQGPLMALFIKGIYQPQTDYAKLTVLGRLSDEIISGLGAFGDFSLNKLMIMLTGEENKYNIIPEDFDKIPQLPMKNTKEFRSVINGIIDKPSSVILFNWISYSQKSLIQKEVPMEKVKLPAFVNELPY